MEKSAGGDQTPPYFLTLVQTIIYSIIHSITNPINHHLNPINHYSIIKSPFSPAITFTPFAPNLTKSISLCKTNSLKNKCTNFSSLEKELNYARNYAILNVNKDMEIFSFNTAVARLMEYVNALYTSALVRDEVEYAVQVNSKMKCKVVLAKDTDEAKIKEIVLSEEKVKEAVEGKTIAKIIIIPNRLINIICK